MARTGKGPLLQLSHAWCAESYGEDRLSVPDSVAFNMFCLQYILICHHVLYLFLVFRRSMS